MKKALMIAALAVAAACGGSSKKTSTNTTLACDTRNSDSSCTEVSAPAAVLSQAGLTAAACTDPGVGGTVVASCPATGRVGRCTYTQATAGGNVGFVLHVYPPATQSDGTTFCTSVNGTWTAG